jgi:DNA topoisomerase-1
LKSSSREVKQLSRAIADSLTSSGDQSGLLYVEEHERLPGLTRKRSGQNFVYLNADGVLVRDREIVTRIEALTIPPAWAKVWICPVVNGHLQATGFDAKGRKQYLYHAQWRSERDAVKFEHLVDFGLALPRLRRRVNRDMHERSLRKTGVIATIIRLLEQSLIRVGSDEYAKENESYGLSTLKNRHARVKGDELIFQFRGKSGIYHAIKVTDSRVARTVERCQDLPGQRLFQYYDETGQLRDVRSEDVNEYIQQCYWSELFDKVFSYLGRLGFCAIDSITAESSKQQKAGAARDYKGQKGGRASSREHTCSVPQELYSSGYFGGVCEGRVDSAKNICSPVAFTFRLILPGAGTFPVPPPNPAWSISFFASASVTLNLPPVS